MLYRARFVGVFLNAQCWAVVFVLKGCNLVEACVCSENIVPFIV